MIYIILTLIAVFCNAVMDADQYIAGYFNLKGYKKLYAWSNSMSWENKYFLKEWLQGKGVPEKIASWLAKDVLVIFTDMWHFCKAVMMICFLIPIRDVTFSLWGEYLNPTLALFVLFSLFGVLFNKFYYSLRKLPDGVIRKDKKFSF